MNYFFIITHYQIEYDKISECIYFFGFKVNQPNPKNLEFFFKFYIVLVMLDKTLEVLEIYSKYLECSEKCILKNNYYRIYKGAMGVVSEFVYLWVVVNNNDRCRKEIWYK